MSKKSRSKQTKKANSQTSHPEQLATSISEVTPAPKQDFKLLISVPATKTSHLPMQKKVLEAIEKAGEGYVYDLHVGEANELGWQHVVDQFNLVADKTVAENYDYVLIVESDVFIADNTLSHMLTVDADVVVAIVPNHSYPDHPRLHELHRNLVCVAWFRDDKHYWFKSCTMQEVKNRILTFKDGPLLAGTGCILIKRKVFESGIRFINALNKASYDIIFWKELAQRGFSGAADGYVICEHGGD